MIPSTRLYYKTLMRFNNLASNEHQDIPKSDWVLAANESLIKLVKKKIGLNNNYGIGYDGFRKRYEDLQVLVVPHVKLSLVEDKTLDNRWSSEKKTTELELPYLMYSDIYITAKKDTCEDRVLIVDIKKHSDIPVLLRNTNSAPSFEYQETLGTISSNKFEVYTDGVFIPQNLYVSYLRYPKKIDLEGYIDLDGNESKNEDCELPDFLEDELLDLITMELGMDTENNNAIQNAQIRSQTNE